MSTALVELTQKLATRLNMGDGTGLVATLKATAFRGQVSDDQMTALMIVANQYGLNPWTREIYAFPDKNNGIVPVVGVDGWARIINEHPQFDGMEFEQTPESCTCIIYRKDRSHPMRVTEYMIECCRDNAIPWKTHPYRMLRHKSMIQCARLAFGFVGIFDKDEAERIIENSEMPQGPAKVIDPATGEIKPKELPPCPDAKFAKNLPSWTKTISEGGKVADLLAMLESKYTLSHEQLAQIDALTVKPADPDPAPDADFVNELGD